LIPELAPPTTSSERKRESYDTNIRAASSSSSSSLHWTVQALGFLYGVPNDQWYTFKL
jgi:hypothetical protein